jgi:hypothetical protein
MIVGSFPIVFAETKIGIVKIRDNTML